jgi:hypothetical protein
MSGGTGSQLKAPEQISDDDLERYYLGMIPEGLELFALEEHLLVCAECIERAETSKAYVDAMRAGLLKRKWDLER